MSYKKSLLASSIRSKGKVNKVNNFWYWSKVVIQIYLDIFEYFGMYYWSGCSVMQVLHMKLYLVIFLIFVPFYLFLHCFLNIVDFWGCQEDPAPLHCYVHVRHDLLDAALMAKQRLPPDLRQAFDLLRMDMDSMHRYSFRGAEVVLFCEVTDTLVL